MTTSSVDHVLNQIEALYLLSLDSNEEASLKSYNRTAQRESRLRRGVSGSGTPRSTLLSELAEHLGKSYGHVFAWIRQRKFKPRTETFLVMQAWTKKRIHLLCADEKLKFEEKLKSVEEFHAQEAA